MAKFEKGNTFGKGRPKGATNRSTEMMKVNVARAINLGLDYIKEDYEKIRKEDPAKALQILTKLMDFALPRMKAVDMEVKAEVNAKIEKLQIEVIQRDGSKDKNK
jgi:hypothetical protein